MFSSTTLYISFFSPNLQIAVCVASRGTWTSAGSPQSSAAELGATTWKDQYEDRLWIYGPFFSEGALRTRWRERRQGSCSTHQADMSGYGQILNEIQNPQVQSSRPSREVLVDVTHEHGILPQGFHDIV